MRIASIKNVGSRPVYDLSVSEVEHYVLKNGVVTHNTGIYYSADTIWILGRQQDKDGKEIKGYNFIINVEKSRYVKEKSKIPISVSWEGGIFKWSGLLELALEHGSIFKPKPGYYDRKENVDSKGIKESVLLKNNAFWESLLKETDIAKFIEDKYKIGKIEKVLGDEEDAMEE